MAIRQSYLMCGRSQCYVALGAGIALLIAKRLTDPQRETAGIILTGVGLLTTVPLAFELLGKSEGKSV